MITARDELKHIIDSDCLSEQEAEEVLNFIEKRQESCLEAQLGSAANRLHMAIVHQLNQEAAASGCQVDELEQIAAAGREAAMERLRAYVSRKGYQPRQRAEKQAEPTKARTAPVAVGILFDVSQILLCLRDDLPVSCADIERRLGGPAVQDVLNYIHPILDPMCGDDEEEQAS